MRLSYQLVNAAENYAREENLMPLLLPTMSRDMDEQLKLAHKVVDVVDRTNRKNCVTLLRYNVDKLENSYAQVQLFARKKEDAEFQQVVYMNYQLEEFIYLLDVMNSVYVKVFTNQPICTVLLSNMVIQITLGFCGEIGKVSTIQCTSRATLLVPYNIVSCSLGSTISTCNFFFSD